MCIRDRLRVSIDEKTALNDLFKIINKHKTFYDCSRAILVGHNAFFDHSFILEACKKNNIKKIENESDIKVNFQVIGNIPLYKKPDQQQYNIIKLKMN